MSGQFENQPDDVETSESGPQIAPARRDGAHISRIYDMCIRAGATGLGWFEYLFQSRKPMQFPPVFILGPPRSGTTLLGQVVTSGLDVARIPELTVRHSRTYSTEPPVVLTTRLALMKDFRHDGANFFESNYGKAGNSSSSSDSNVIWSKMLQSDGPLDRDTVRFRRRQYAYRQIAGVERLFGRPIVDKSVGHCIRIPALLQMFPDALFVRCRRDVLAVAQSCWIGRSIYGPDIWLVSPVRGYEKLVSRPLELQCAATQFLFEKEIDEGLEQVPVDRIVEVDYADVCASPVTELGRISDLMARNGVAVDTLGGLPDSFGNAHERKIPMKNYEEIIRHLECYWNRNIVRLHEPKI